MGSRRGASPPFHDRGREQYGQVHLCVLRGARCFESLPRTVLQRSLPLRASGSCSCWSGILIFQGASAQLATLLPLYPHGSVWVLVYLCGPLNLAPPGALLQDP